MQNQKDLPIREYTRTELKNKKEQILPDTITEEMATPFRSIVYFDYADLRGKFDEYWEMTHHMFEKKFKVKGKKGKGGRIKNSKEYLERTVGHTKLYGEVLWHEASEKLGDPLFFNAISLESFEPGCTYAVCVYYKCPTMKLRGDIDFKLVREISYDKEDAWEKRCKELQYKYRSVAPYVGDECVKETQQVLLDLVANCEGVPYPNATAQGMWFDVVTIAIKTLKTELLSHKRGDLFEISFENDDKKKVDVQVKIHDIKDIQLPVVDDDLAKDAGFDDLTTLQNKFYEEYDNYVKNAEESLACDHILTELITKSDIGPVPNEYVRLNVDNSIKDFVDNHRGDKNKAMRSIGAHNEGEMRSLFTGQVHRDLYQKIAMRYYADIYNIDYDTGNILSDMRNRIDWYIKEDETCSM